MKIYMNDFEKNLSETLSVKKNQMKVVEKLMNVMQRLIVTKERGPAKMKFKKRFEGEDDTDYMPSAINELLKYLYVNLTHLFNVENITKDRLMIELESIYHILDEIPDELLERCSQPPQLYKKDQQCQTAFTMNLKKSLRKQELYDEYIEAYPEARIKVKNVVVNHLLKAIKLYLKKKKEKINPTSEGNSHKLINTIIEDKLKLDID